LRAGQVSVTVLEAANDECRQLSILDLANLFEVAFDQHLDCGVCFCDRSENLPGVVRYFNIFKAEFVMPLVIFTVLTDYQEQLGRHRKGLLDHKSVVNQLEARSRW
jgi:hypothetical protein